MSFTYLGRNCPICNGARKDCRRNNQNGIIHCRDGSANPIGWHLIREDAQGFLMWGEGDGKDAISSEERERRQQEQRLERKRQDEEKRRGALPSSERDTAIRKLSNHFGLAQRHRDDLKRRELTDEQIEKLLFFTIQPGERVPMGVPENLPGVKNGRIWGREGYACPTFNPEGQATGYQIRLENPDDGGKYRWAKGAVSSHLPNGELPITYARPLNGQIKRHAIGICEGILKPAIAAQKLGQIFIGASGFMFSKEGDDSTQERVPFEQLKAYLEAASAELGTKDVELYPDGGVVQNPQMYQKYQWLWNALAKLGYRVKIAWWGQVDKDKPDCDGLLEDQELKRISPGTFADYAKRFGGADSAWMQKVRREWRKNRTFTPDFTDSEKWVNWGLPADGTIFFGRARLGSGKTTQLKKWVELWRKRDNDTRFFVLGYRNTLLLQTAAQMGFQHIHETEAILRKDDRTSFCLCVDSLLKFIAEDFDGSVIFLDELMSVIKHLLHSPTIPKTKRDKILELFEEAIRRAKTIVCMDGLMADWAVGYIAEIAPEKKILKAQNIYKAEKPVINFLMGTQDLDEKIKPNDRSPWVKLMLESPVYAVASDSQVFLEAMERLILARYPEAQILRIDSKTVPEDYAKAFLADCNTYIKANEIDVLLYSPSAESGVDVSIPDYFTHHFGFFFGVLGVDAIIQMLGRIRDPNVRKFVWCKEWVAVDEKKNVKSPFLDQLGRAYIAIVQEELFKSREALGDELSDETKDRIFAKARKNLDQSADIHFRTSNCIEAIENAEKANLRSFLRDALLKEGYGVNELILPSSFEDKELEKETKESVKRQNASDIFNAPVQDEEIVDLAGTRLRYDARWEDRCRRMKAVLLDRLPGIRDEEVWDEDFIYLTMYEDRDFISRQELFWLYHHPEEAQKEGSRRLHWFAKTDKTFIGNIRSRFLKIQAYRDLEIHRFFDLDATWSDSSPEIQDLLERCKNPAIAKILGHPGKMSGIKNLNRLLKPLGIFLRESAKSRDGEKIIRFYKIDSEAYFKPARLKVLEAIGVRYEKAKLKEEPLDWNQIFEPAADNPGSTSNGANSWHIPRNLLIDNGVCATPPSEESIEKSEPEQALWEVCDNAKKSPEKSGEGAIGEIFEAAEKSPEKSGEVVTGKNLEATGEIFEAPEKSRVHAWVGNIPIIIPKKVAALAASGVAVITMSVRGLPAVAASSVPQNPVEISQPEKSQRVQEYHWDELPKPGMIVRWIDRRGSEKLELRHVDPDGRCQVKSLLSGIFTNTHIGQLRPSPS